jgi:hypothetical protein
MAGRLLLPRSTPTLVDQELADHLGRSSVHLEMKRAMAVPEAGVAGTFSTTTAKVFCTFHRDEGVVSVLGIDVLDAGRHVGCVWEREVENTITILAEINQFSVIMPFLLNLQV